MKWDLGKYFLLASASMFSAGLWAFPANPTPFSVDNAGDSLTLRNGGDEHYRYTQTEDGYLVISDSTGVYYFADENGAASSVKAKNADLRNSSDKAFLRKLDKSKVRKAHQKRHPDRLVRPARKGKSSKPDWVPSTESAPPLLRLPSAESHVTGTNRFPVLLVAAPSASNADSTKYWNQLNQTGYTENNHLGSVRDYFTAQSNGLFVPVFDIYLVSVSQSLSSYKNSEHALIEEAITSLKANYPQFDPSLYDADGDGNIDATPVLYAGTESAASNLGGYQYELQWDGGKISAGNGKKFNSYFIISQMSNSTKLLPIATFVHEFSHTMGLKDHYCVAASDCYSDFTNNTYQAPGAHAWDVMSTGMYNNGGGKPVGYSAFEKAFMGWMSYTTLSSSDEISVLGALNSTQFAYKVPVSGNQDEWYVIENRQKDSWDASLPNHGLLIWHIDYDENAWYKDILNDVAGHQRVDVVEAGNLKVTEYYDGFNSTHLVDDAFPGSQNVTSFTAFNSWAGTNLGVNLYNILEENGKVCFATKSGVSVGSCTVVSSSSSVSSSSEQSSSSEAVSSSSVALTQSQYAYIVNLPKDSLYAKKSVDLHEALEFLGVTGTANSLYESGELLYYAVESDGSLNANSTAMAPGHWFDASGNVCNWDADGSVARIFSELDLASGTANIGQFPQKVDIGEIYTIRQALVYGEKRVDLTFVVVIAAEGSLEQTVPEDSSLSIANSRAQSGISTLALRDNVLEVNTSLSGRKNLAVYDLTGKILYRESFDGFAKNVSLTNLQAKGVVVVRLSQNGRILSLKRMAVH
ncbi:MAG: M6 family metalloprotease domain-containing protein [Fibrobacter sp.]|nr:M6 family metalloprotease domain-containing protein [Fibrobacter sp.]